MDFKCDGFYVREDVHDEKSGNQSTLRLVRGLSCSRPTMFTEVHHETQMQVTHVTFYDKHLCLTL